MEFCQYEKVRTLLLVFFPRFALHVQLVLVLCNLRLQILTVILYYKMHCIFNQTKRSEFPSSCTRLNDFSFRISSV